MELRFLTNVLPQSMLSEEMITPTFSVGFSIDTCPVSFFIHFVSNKWYWLSLDKTKRKYKNVMRDLSQSAPFAWTLCQHVPRGYVLRKCYNSNNLFPLRLSNKRISPKRTQLKVKINLTESVKAALASSRKVIIRFRKKIILPKFLHSHCSELFF